MIHKYEEGQYIVYPFNAVGGRMKDKTEMAGSICEGDEIGVRLMQEGASSYVVLRVLRNSATGKSSPCVGTGGCSCQS